MIAAKQCVVLIDDSPLNVKTHALLLERLPNIVTRSFSSSAEAVAWAETNDVDCFIVDFRMPPPDGIEVTKILRSRPSSALTPIIMVTGEGDRAARYAALDAGVNDFVAKPVDPREFVARVGTFLALNDARKKLDARVGDLTVSLSHEEQRTREHAARLEALCGLATNPRLDDDEMLTEVLTQSAAGLRSDEHFYASLLRIDGEDAVLEVFGRRPGGAGPGELKPGTRFALADAPLSVALERGTAVAWDDVQSDPTLKRYKRLHKRNVRAQLLAPMRAGGRDYILVYNSHEPTQHPFNADDLSYASIVAAFLQARYQQRWQSERILYQSQHDALTGLMNRTRFRAFTRDACLGEDGCSIAVVDIIDFSGVNLRYGNLVGDALLVEAAAGLAAIAQEGEFVGRLGGDMFGIGLPGITTEARLEERLRAYLAVFDQPFSTGDREGREFVSVAARIGAATFSNGLVFNDLLSRADQAVERSRSIDHSTISIYGAAAVLS